MTTEDESWSVMSWNILAHEFTSFECKNHLNKIEGKANAVEHVDQFVQRCQRARQTILSRNSALVLLQEVSFSFLNDSFHGGLCPPSESLDQLHHQYHVATAYGDSGRGANEPGTAILVRKDLSVFEHFVLPGGRTTTGGTSKSACAVCVQLADMRVWCVSIHTTWGGTEDAARMRLHHLQLLHEALAHRLLPSDSVLIAGDFNCSDRDPLIAGLVSSSCLTKLTRVILPGNTFTHDDGTTRFQARRAFCSHTSHRRHQLHRPRLYQL